MVRFGTDRDVTIFGVGYITRIDTIDASGIGASYVTCILVRIVTGASACKFTIIDEIERFDIHIIT